MPTLEDFQNILQSAQQEKVVQSPLYQKVAKEAMMQQQMEQQRQQEIPPEIQAVFDELKGTQERNAVRDKLQRYNAAIQYKCGGYVNKFDGVTGPSSMDTFVQMNPITGWQPQYYQDFGIGNHPAFDEDFRNRYGLRYAPYNEIDFNGTDPDNIRLPNQGNVTARAYSSDPSATFLVGPDNRIINQQRLSELSNQYRRDNASMLNQRYAKPLSEKPLEQKNPEFYLLAGGAHALQGLANKGLTAAFVDPMANMVMTDKFIDNTTPYSGWGNMMSNEVGGPEWAWDLTHPAFAKDLWNLTKAAGKSAYNWMARNTPESAYNMGIMPEGFNPFDDFNWAEFERQPGAYIDDGMSSGWGGMDALDSGIGELGSTGVGSRLQQKVELQKLLDKGWSQSEAEEFLGIAPEKSPFATYDDAMKDFKQKLHQMKSLKPGYFDTLKKTPGYDEATFMNDLYEMGIQDPYILKNVPMYEWPTEYLDQAMNGAYASKIPFKDTMRVRRDQIDFLMSEGGMSREEAEQKVRSQLENIYNRNRNNDVIDLHEGLIPREEFDPKTSQFDTYEDYLDSYNTLNDTSKDTFTDTLMANFEGGESDWQNITGLDTHRYIEEAPHGSRINIHSLSTDSYPLMLKNLIKGARKGMDKGIKVISNGDTYYFNNMGMVDAAGNPLTTYDDIVKLTDKVNDIYGIGLPYPSQDLKTFPGFTVFKYGEGGPINSLKSGGKTSNNEQLWNRARPLYNELTAAGVPHMAAIGVLGNIALESSVNPNASNKVNGGHWGYTQNDKAITNHIKKYYGGYGHEEQMQFLKDGLTGQIRGAKQAPWLQKRFDEYKQSVGHLNDPAKAALMWEKYYEKSANEAIDKRADYAKYFHDALGSPDYQYSPDRYNGRAGLGPLVGETTEQEVSQEAAPWYNQYQLNDNDYAELYEQSNAQLPMLDPMLAWNPMQPQYEGTYPNLFVGGGDTRYVKDTVDAIKKTFNEKVGSTPSYDDLTYSDEWADAHGYYPDARGHRDDRVKKPAHPTYPGRGQFVGNEFHFTNDGLNDVNRTLWGLIDNGDGKTVPVYNNTFVLPELTVTPNGSYIQNTYDNIKYFAGGGYIEDGLRSLGVNGFKVTSGYRGPNSKVGKAGKRSGHARTLKDGSSGAIDIVPTDKSPAGWARLEQQLRQPEVQQFLASFGGTILDERDAATMKKTGATGQHFHIGLGVKGGGNFYNQPTTQQEYAQRSPVSVFSPIQSSTVQENPYTPWYAQGSRMTDEDWAALYNQSGGAAAFGIPAPLFGNEESRAITFPALV